MFSSHKTIQESMYKRLYKNNQWLKVGCMVPKISDDPDVRMCISGFLAEGSSNDVRVTKDSNSNSLAGLYGSASPSILFKPFRSSLYPEVGKFKSPTGLLTSRNTALFHSPNALDTLLCEGEAMWATKWFSTLDNQVSASSLRKTYLMSRRLTLCWNQHSLSSHHIFVHLTSLSGIPFFRIH